MTNPPSSLTREEWLHRSMELQKSVVRLFPIADSVKWSRFVEAFQKQAMTIPPPFSAVERLAQSYLKTGGDYPVLDVGCETGKNAKCLIDYGHTVTILDIAPKAVQYTIENLKHEGLRDGVTDAIVGRIERLDSRAGPFKAVVGTYAFSFIHPDLFEEVMIENVLKKIAPEGFFAGGFFGQEHGWASRPGLSIMTVEKITSFFSTNGVSVLEVVESKKDIQTVSNGRQHFHTISVIAQRIL
ncbi:MAG: hypothetical protein S4CHLAM123_11490 [Chlamydiales bacterium]|nr:hypothetical protein [Chlamydiales bacterium]